MSDVWRRLFDGPDLPEERSRPPRGTDLAVLELSPKLEAQLKRSGCPTVEAVVREESEGNLRYLMGIGPKSLAELYRQLAAKGLIEHATVDPDGQS